MSNTPLGFRTHNRHKPGNGNETTLPGERLARVVKTTNLFCLLKVPLRPGRDSQLSVGHLSLSTG